MWQGFQVAGTFSEKLFVLQRFTRHLSYPGTCIQDEFLTHLLTQFTQGLGWSWKGRGEERRGNYSLSDKPAVDNDMYALTWWSALSLLNWLSISPTCSFFLPSGYRSLLNCLSISPTCSFLSPGGQRSLSSTGSPSLPPAHLSHSYRISNIEMHQNFLAHILLINLIHILVQKESLPVQTNKRIVPCSQYNPQVLVGAPFYPYLINLLQLWRNI